jgi:membrane protease YdiL (CAAX protease family)
MTSRQRAIAVTKTAVLVLYSIALALLVLNSGSDDATTPTLFVFVFVALMVFGLFGVYEGLAHGLARLLVRRAPAGESPPDTRDVRRGPNSEDDSAPSGPVRVRQAFLVLVAYLVTQVIVGIIVALAVASSPALSVDSHDFQQVIQRYTPLALLLAVLAGTAAVLLMVRVYVAPRSSGLAETVGWGVGSKRSLAVMGGIGAGLALAYLATALWFVPPTSSQVGGEVAAAARVPGLSRLAWAFIGLALAPWIEEFLFRGLLLGTLVRKWGAAGSVALVTILFVGIHLTETRTYWPAIIAVTAMAIAAAMARLKTGLLGPAIAAHLGYNAVMVVVVYVLYGY